MATRELLEGADALAEALMLMVNCMKELNLFRNNISAVGAAALVEPLKINCTLTALFPPSELLIPSATRSWHRWRTLRK